MNKKFTIELCSDVDYEGMVIDISYNMQNIALVNYEKGIENMEIEILPRGKKNEKIIFPLDGFLIAIEKAKKIAIHGAEEDKAQKENS